MLGAFFYCSPPCFLRQDLLLNLELPMSVKLVAQQPWEALVSALPALRL